MISENVLNALDKKNIKRDNPELKKIVSKFIEDYKVKGFKNQPEVLPYLWWTSKNIWAFRLENNNNSWDIALVDMDSMKATYLFNCYPKMLQNMSYDDNDTDFHLTIKYDEKEE